MVPKADMALKLAYSAHPDGRVLLTDAVKIPDPHLKDGIREWRDGHRFYKDQLASREYSSRILPAV
ncbi:hypothetical protein BU15DRAFT_72363 [Melanogaster broomeanus]|nr:hypothetical protein BU15DRAFT_72363 [Melanogaster broomeanus]